MNSSKNHEPSNGRSLKCTLAPFFILPIMLLVATISRVLTIIVMAFMGMGALYIISRPHHRNRSPSFFSWTLSSGFYIFLVFEFYIMKFWPITYNEYSILILLFGFTCYFFYKMMITADFELATGSAKGIENSLQLNSDHDRKKYEIEIDEGYFDSIWWDCRVYRSNYGYFLAGHIFCLATLLFASYLNITTICRSNIFYGSILMPENCEAAYYKFYLSIIFVTSVYGLGYALVIGLVLLHQLLSYFINFGASPWKRIVDVFNV